MVIGGDGNLYDRRTAQRIGTVRHEGLTVQTARERLDWLYRERLVSYCGLPIGSWGNTGEVWVLTDEERAAQDAEQRRIAEGREQQRLANQMVTLTLDNGQVINCRREEADEIKERHRKAKKAEIEQMLRELEADVS